MLISETKGSDAMYVHLWDDRERAIRRFLQFAQGSLAISKCLSKLRLILRDVGNEEETFELAPCRL